MDTSFEEQTDDQYDAANANQTNRGAPIDTLDDPENLDNASDATIQTKNSSITHIEHYNPSISLDDPELALQAAAPNLMDLLEDNVPVHIPSNPEDKGTPNSHHPSDVLTQVPILVPLAEKVNDAAPWILGPQDPIRGIPKNQLGDQVPRLDSHSPPCTPPGPGSRSPARASRIY